MVACASSRRENMRILFAALLMLAAPILESDEAPSFGLLLEGAEAEEFLRTAEVLEMERIPVGVTEPSKVTLLKGELTLHAVWKTIDEEQRIEQLDGKVPEIGFRDSYKHEIAAYELDKLLGLGLVPPTVGRKIDREKGSLQLWLEGVMTDTERRKKDIQPPNPQAWNNQMFTIRLFLQLTHDTDYNNVSNLLIDPDFRIYAIDFSRAFRLQRKLRKEESLTRFSKTVIDRLRTLDDQMVKDNLGPWLSNGQIKSLLIRRDEILELVDVRIAERSEAAVMFP
jgi:hypothetical protein